MIKVRWHNKGDQSTQSKYKMVELYVASDTQTPSSALSPKALVVTLDKTSSPQLSAHPFFVFYVCVVSGRAIM